MFAYTLYVCSMSGISSKRSKSFVEKMCLEMLEQSKDKNSIMIWEFKKGVLTKPTFVKT